MTVPRSVLFELTRRCNLNCVHCYIVDNQARGDVTTAEAVDLLEQLADWGVLFLALSGGELFVRRDWFEIATAAHRLHFAVTLFTNATLITPDVADQIAGLNVTKVEVSLHGSRAETVDAITQVTGSYDRILAGIRLLRARGVRVKIKANVLAANAAEAHTFVAHAAALGVEVRTVSPVLIPRLDNDPAPLQQMLSAGALETYYREEYQRLCDEALRQAWRFPCASDQHICAIGLAEWVVSADAFLYPCFNWRLRGFNLRRMRLAEAATRIEELYPEMIGLQWQDLAPCTEGHQQLRPAHCGALSLRLTGDVRAHLPGFCNHASAQEHAYQAEANRRGWNAVVDAAT